MIFKIEIIYLLKIYINGEIYKFLVILILNIVDFFDYCSN